MERTKALQLQLYAALICIMAVTINSFILSVLLPRFNIVHIMVDIPSFTWPFILGSLSLIILAFVKRNYCASAYLVGGILSSIYSFVILISALIKGQTMQYGLYNAISIALLPVFYGSLISLPIVIIVLLLEIHDTKKA